MTSTIPGRPHDASRLQSYLRREIPGFAGPLAIERLPGGQSNPTYLLRTPAARYVLRSKPVGELLGSAHAVDREFRVTYALCAHTEVPVARPLVLCTDDEVFGSWFYVMEHVDGRIFWDAALPEVDRADRPLCFQSMVGTLATLHNVDYAAIGLGDFGRPGSYFTRQVRRWSAQYLGDEAAGKVAALDRLVEWLPENIPPSEEVSLVHGDYRIDNLVFHPSEPRVVAVLDWELSTIGHPLADFGYHVMMYRMPSLGVTGLAGQDLAALNLPVEAEYVASYCAATGRESIPDLDFYVVFNLFRLAAILHGIRGRAARGTAASGKAREYAAMVEPVADLAWSGAQSIMSAQRAS